MPEHEGEDRERLLQALEKSVAVIGGMSEQADELDRQANELTAQAAQLQAQARVLHERAVTTRAVAQAAQVVLMKVAEEHHRGRWGSPAV